MKACVKDKYGRSVIIKGVYQGEEITIMNLSCQSNYTPDFLTKTFSEFTELSSAVALVGGDFNCSLSPLIDRRPSQSSPLTNQAHALSAICEEVKNGKFSIHLIKSSLSILPLTNATLR